MSIIETWVDEHGDYLFGYVLPRVRDRHLAEELVQESFLAALKAVESFRGDSSPNDSTRPGLGRGLVESFGHRHHGLRRVEWLHGAPPGDGVAAVLFISWVRVVWENGTRTEPHALKTVRHRATRRERHGLSP